MTTFIEHPVPATDHVRYVAAMKRRYYVVFTDRLSPHRHWWDIFTRKGWRHCYVLWQPLSQTHQPVIQVSAMFWGVGVHYTNGHIDDACSILMREDWCSSILVVDCQLPGSLPFACRGPITCVTIIKAMLGIRARRIWTPFQLHRYLINKGAQSWAVLLNRS